jgi:hypothetical protein
VAELPYLPGGTTSEYFDLRTQPSRTKEIPELRREPALVPIVADLNHADGEFITHGCAAAPRLPEKRDCVIPTPKSAKDARCCYSSYVMFSFWLLHMNEERYYKAIYDAYVDKERYSICFVLQPAYFLSREEISSGTRQDGTNATVCLAWTSGWGATEKEAHDRWRSSIQDLVTFFRKRRVSNGPFERTGITVSDRMFD